MQMAAFSSGVILILNLMQDEQTTVNVERASAKELEDLYRCMRVLDLSATRHVNQFHCSIHNLP